MSGKPLFSRDFWLLTYGNRLLVCIHKVSNKNQPNISKMNNDKILSLLSNGDVRATDGYSQYIRRATPEEVSTFKNLALDMMGHD